MVIAGATRVLWQRSPDPAKSALVVPAPAAPSAFDYIAGNEKFRAAPPLHDVDVPDHPDGRGHQGGVATGDPTDSILKIIPDASSACRVGTTPQLP